MLNRIPDFTNQGVLPKGVHRCSGDEFLARYCIEKRKIFKKSISDTFDFAKEHYAKFLFFGGSFITENNEPGDIDCLMVFDKDMYIPPRTERLLIEGTKLDILFGSLESKDIIDAYLHLFGNNRQGADVGIIQVDLYGNNEEWSIKQPSYDKYEIVKRAYTDRHFIDLNKSNGVLVSIHGLLSDAKWNMEIAPIASSQGWIFAPYIYDTNYPDLLLNPSKRRKVIDEFRNWIYEINERFESPISVIAHSFGTYIIASYINGFDIPPVCFNSLILTGSIINDNFNWEEQRGKVARVLNEIAPNDLWVNFMPKNNFKKIGIDPLFGKSGVSGFNKKCEILKETSNDIFTHTNVIKRDIIETKWMPFLNVNRYSYLEEQAILLRRSLKKE